MQMARILAEAREKAQQEVGRNKSPHSLLSWLRGREMFYKMIEHGLGLGSINESEKQDTTITHIYIYMYLYRYILTHNH